jgi:predicted nucleotidyltransferase
MSKIPKVPSEIYEEFTEEYKNIFGDDLISIILYGSGAKGEYKYKKSDINFMIVLSEAGMNNLSRCLALIPKWHKRYVSTPLFLTKEYISSSLDAFPFEFFEMKMNYQCIYGEDVLDGIEIKKQHLRLQCEREMKGHLLHLREGYLSTAHVPKRMRSLIVESLRSFKTIFSGLLRLKEADIPKSSREIYLETAKVFELDFGVFQRLIKLRESKEKITKTELLSLMECYIQEITKLTQSIDQL